MSSRSRTSRVSSSSSVATPVAATKPAVKASTLKKSSSNQGNSKATPSTAVKKTSSNKSAPASKKPAKRQSKQPVKTAINNNDDNDDDDDDLYGDEDAAEDENDEDDDEGDDDEDEEGLNPLAGLDGADMGSLMHLISTMKQQSGPIVSCVLLNIDGTSKQIDVDMTPRLNAVVGFLGGEVTLVARFPKPLDAVVMGLRNDAKKPRNQHQLPPPMSNEQLRGPLLLVKMDKEGVNPVPLLLSDYEKFVANPPASAAANSDSDKENDSSNKSPANKSKTATKRKGMSTEEAAASSRNKRKASDDVSKPQDDSSRVETVAPASNKRRKTQK